MTCFAVYATLIQIANIRILIQLGRKLIGGRLVSLIASSRLYQLH